MDRATKKLLAWYGRHKRNLPWRKTRDAYNIFISELMLQQTQVDRVVPKYRAWVERFPNWKTLAEAKTSELLRAWAGLGYNRRALYARDAAQQVMRDGEPKTEGAWRRLKGVGPYMAAALSEFASHRRAIVIDTNVRRVAGRVFVGRPYPQFIDDPKIQRQLERVTPKSGKHWELPQAFMDLGSSICLVRSPHCSVCPLQKTCKASRLFLSGRAGRKTTKKTTERIHNEKRWPDRIYRGRILAWIMKHGAAKVRTLGTNIDETFDPIADDAWLRDMAGRLVNDGLLARRRGDILSLPKS